MSELIKGVAASDDKAYPVAVDTDGHLQVDVLGATIDADVTLSSTVVVTGGAGQVADVKVTLDSEAVVLNASTAEIGKLGAGTAIIGALVADQTIDLNKVGGSAVAVGHGTAAAALRVELPTDGTGIVGLAAGTNAVGKLAANSGVDIGDVDVTSVVPGTGATNLGKAEDAAHSSGDVGVMALAVRNDAGTVLSGTTGDYTPLSTDSAGALRVAMAQTATTRVSKRVAATAGVTGGTVWTPTGGKKFVLRKLSISCVVGGTIEFFDATDSGNTVVGPIFSLAANSGWSETWREEALYVSAVADNVLKYTTSASFVGSVYVEGYEL